MCCHNYARPANLNSPHCQKVETKQKGVKEGKKKNRRKMKRGQNE
jgi:hypothetical protein